MKLRVFKKADGTLRICYPISKTRLPGECDDAFHNRVFLRCVEADPTLAGLEHFDIENDQLPDTTEFDAQGDLRILRPAWRAFNNTVIIDREHLKPNWNGLLNRLKSSVPSERKAQLADRWTLLVEAIKDNNLDMLQTIYDRIKTAMGTANPPLTQTQWEYFQNMLIEKDIAIIL